MTVDELIKKLTDISEVGLGDAKVEVALGSAGCWVQRPLFEVNVMRLHDGYMVSLDADT